MVVHTGAVAICSSVWCFLCVFVLCLLTKFCYTNYVCSHKNLTDFGLQYKLPVTYDFQWTHNILEDIARTLGSPWIVIGPSRRRRRRRERKQKRRCWLGLHARLSNQLHKPPLPSIFLTNARSLQITSSEIAA